MKTLKSGSKGPEVRILQEALNDFGYKLKVDGDFGPNTKWAVKDYQNRNGLSVDGIAGAKTWSSLGFPSADPVTPGRIIKKLIIHCSATPEGKEYTSEDISNWHKANNYSYYIDPATGKKMYVGYHYLIHLDGRIEACRPENIRGCHVANHNSDSLGICLIGGVDANGKPKDTRTEAQKKALEMIVRQKLKEHPGASVHGHNEFAAKACPSFNVKEWIREISL